MGLMRKDSFGVGDFVHVYNCGNRKASIVRDLVDQYRFLACLRYYNDHDSGEFLMRAVFGQREDRYQSPWKIDAFRDQGFVWPRKTEQKPIVNVISYVLMENHYHLVLQEITQGGITEFMRKIGTGYTLYSNIRHNELGKVFQGSYKARLISTARYLQYIDIYVQTLNPLDALRAKKSINNFDLMFDAVVNDPFSGLGESLGIRNFEILNRKNFIQQSGLPANIENYKNFAREAILEKGLKKFLGDLTLEKD